MQIIHDIQAHKKPISAIIRERLQKENLPFHANDTIHDCIKPEEISLLKVEVEQKVKSLLESLVIDIEQDHNTNGTAKRIAKKYIDEIFKGRYQDPPTVTSFPNFKNLDEIYMVGPIAMRSTCSHHFAPIIGQVWIGVDPVDRVIGLSKFHRITDWIVSRPQIQEEAVISLADYIENIMKPKGIAVLMKAQHFCMCWRGVKDDDTLMKNLVLRGTLKEMNLKNQFLELVKL